ncbi:MAG: PLP-dependent aminotransferase family protein, partial [Gammaproteobacteria bacterium]|nr:PLP-dependent aminotransferase family protein [Gammaproteobacteria bacterium]
MPTLIPVEAIFFDQEKATPIYRQLYDFIQQAIVTGEFPAKAQLPSSRLLSKELCISRSTVTTTYDQLIAEGYLTSQRGSGTTVAKALKPAHLEHIKPEQEDNELSVERLSTFGQAYLKSSKARNYANYKDSLLAVSLPSIVSFPHGPWGRILSKYAKKPLSLEAGYDHPTGIYSLKTAVASYLGLSRGVNTGAENVLILNSTQAAVDLLCRVLLQAGDCCWMEDPGYNGIRLAMSNCAASIVGISVDSEGLKIPTGEHSPKVIYTTPSHQYPTGVTMSYSRRMSLLDYAHKNQSWILEDDYDSEFRYRGKPLPSLQGLDQFQQVIYLGTFSKSVSPSLRVAYMVVPDSLKTVLEAIFADTGQGVTLSVQQALAEFIQDGHYSQHIRKTRQLYSIKQQLLVDAIHKHLSGEVSVSKSQAGLQTTIIFNHQINDLEVVALSRKAGLAVRALSPLYQTQQPQHGLILGFAATENEEIEPAVIKLAKIIR